ncbi:MAG: NAD(P)-binding domain-containing protein [Desulfurococcales archaeon]|nr:NAD(P)-binding domain-containing protein [Desulfurococcales archaeon]
MKPRLFVTRTLPGGAIDRLKKYYDVTVWEEYGPPPYEVLRREASRSDALATLLTDRIDCSLIEEASPRLRIVSQYAVGYDNIDIECATRHGVYVTNTPGVLTDATADLTWALILAVTRRIVEADKEVRSGAWYAKGVGWHPTYMLGIEVTGKTLGIIGMGRIGREVARRARGFKMRILYYDKSRLPEDLEKELNAKYTPLEELLKESDIVTIHVPLTRETRGMIGERELKLMKNTAVLINTARGPIVDTDALVKALREGWIAGAGIDVFDQEPIPPDHPLIKLPNTVLTPHIGSATIETRTRMADLVAENLIAFAESRIPPTLVNRDVVNVRPPGF